MIQGIQPITPFENKVAAVAEFLGSLVTVFLLAKLLTWILKTLVPYAPSLKTQMVISSVSVLLSVSVCVFILPAGISPEIRYPVAGVIVWAYLTFGGYRKGERD